MTSICNVINYVFLKFLLNFKRCRVKLGTVISSARSNVIGICDKENMAKIMILYVLKRSVHADGHLHESLIKSLFLQWVNYASSHREVFYQRLTTQAFLLFQSF